MLVAAGELCKVVLARVVRICYSYSSELCTIFSSERRFEEESSSGRHLLVSSGLRTMTGLSCVVVLSSSLYVH